MKNEIEILLEKIKKRKETIKYCIKQSQCFIKIHKKEIDEFKRELDFNNLHYDKIMDTMKKDCDDKHPYLFLKMILLGVFIMVVLLFGIKLLNNEDSFLITKNNTEVSEIEYIKWNCSVWKEEFEKLQKPKIENCTEEIKFNNGLEIPDCYIRNSLESFKFQSEVNKILSEFYECRYLEYKQNYIISKDDLSIEWLENNCETARCTACEDLKCENQKCDLYYCGDYEVKIK